MRIAVPSPVILVGLMLADNPDEAIADRSTVPVKPLNALTVMLDVPDAPASIGPMIVELAVTLKSGPWRIVKPTTTECDVDGPVPVTLAVYEPPEEPEQDKVEVPVPDKLRGFRLQARFGELVTVERATEPVNPFT